MSLLKIFKIDTSALMIDYIKTRFDELQPIIMIDSKIKAKSFYNKFENDTFTLLARRDDKRDARISKGTN